MKTEVLPLKLVSNITKILLQFLLDTLNQDQQAIFHFPFLEFLDFLNHIFRF